MKKIALSILFISTIVLGKCTYAENLNPVEINSSIMETTKTLFDESSDNINVRNLSYDPSTKVLTGETEAGADVFVISDRGQGVWTADEKGFFSCELELSKPGDILKVSAGYNNYFGTAVEFVIPENKNISVRNLSYDPSTKVLTGETEAGADVFVISDRGQGVWTADEKGFFSCELELSKPGDILKVSAGYNNYFGTAVEFVIPKNKELTEGTFADKYIKIKAQIELLVKNGDLTKEQGDSFLAKVESAKKVEELDIIWQKVEKQVTTNKTIISSKEKETKNGSKSTNQLPKTGESKINIGLVGIGFLLILSLVVIKYKSRKFNN